MLTHTHWLSSVLPESRDCGDFTTRLPSRRVGLEMIWTRRRTTRGGADNWAVGGRIKGGWGVNDITQERKGQWRGELFLYIYKKKVVLGGGGRWGMCEREKAAGRQRRKGIHAQLLRTTAQEFKEQHAAKWRKTDIFMFKKSLFGGNPL